MPYKLSLRIIGYYLFLVFGLGIAVKLFSFDFSNLLMGIFFPGLILFMYYQFLQGDESFKKWIVLNLFLKAILYLFPVYKILTIIEPVEDESVEEINNMIYLAVAIPGLLGLSFILISIYLVLTSRQYSRYIAESTI